MEIRRWVTSELFQCPTPDLEERGVVGTSGEDLGRITAQIIELKEQTVRYLFLETPLGTVLIPATSLRGFDDSGRVILLVSGLEGLPLYQGEIDRSFEERVHQALGIAPYWG